MKTKSKKPLLTPKRRAFIQAKINNPTMTNADAVIQAGYNAKNVASASAMANTIMKQPAVAMALQEHVDLAEAAIVGTIRDWGNTDNTRKREIATQNAQYLHDKVFGKATVKIEQHSSIVKIMINLTNDGEEAPPEMLEDQP